MAAPRLPFLWPMLARGFETSSACATSCACRSPALRSARAASRMRALHSSSPRHGPEPVIQRYGTANEPPPHLSGSKAREATHRQSEPTKALPKIGEKLQRDGEAEIRAEEQSQHAATSQVLDQDSKEREAEKETRGFTLVGDPSSKRAATASRETVMSAAESQVSQRPPEGLHSAERHPMESLLHTVPDPAKHAEELHESSANINRDARREESASNARSTISPEEQTESQRATESRSLTPVVPRAPHLNAPRFVHHFDTYSLVRQLETSGWTGSQAITIMKATRLILADNMDLAHDALLSKSQIENETYLFKAACAELKTEVTSRRQADREQMHTQRVQLQHEVEMLTQRIGQESGALKDELKGMFDDRRMAVRTEQTGMDSKIQRLNYRITVDLQADGKSEVEGLRWVMTRRVIIALGVVVIMVLGSLKLYSSNLHDRDQDPKRRAANNHKNNNNVAQMSSQDRSSDGGANPSPNGNPSSSSLTGSDMMVNEGDNPAFVSLG